MKKIRIPGDKSISHRIAMVASLAEGPCSITHYNTGADCASTLRCLERLGTEIRMEKNLRIIPRTWKAPGNALDCGNSGSTIRMLTGLLAGQNIPAILTGDASLKKRPMKRVADPLRQMGAVLRLGDEEYAPVELIEGAKQPIEYTLSIGSAQVKTAILFAGLRFPGTKVIEKVPSRDHTERLFEYLQIQKGRIPSFDYVVPGDPSSAAFLVLRTLLFGKEPLLLEDVLINEHRIGYIRLLQQAGAEIAMERIRWMQKEPVADLLIKPAKDLAPLNILPEQIPSLIDEIPVLSLVGIRYGFQVHGAKELRYKESDRIHAMVSNLRTMGISVMEWEDGYRIEPGPLKAATACCFGDHRIAMTFATAGLTVDDPQSISISFPEFFHLLKEVTPVVKLPSR